MKKNPASKSGIFNPRVLLAFTLCSIGASLGVFSLAGMTDWSADLPVTVPGFHAQVQVPGSTSGGNESYVGIAFTGSRTGNRVQAWQGATRYNISPDGVNWNFATGQIPGTSGGGDVSTAVDAFGAYYIMEFCTATQGELQACLHKSTDGGATWTTTTIANVAPNPIDRPWMEVYPKLGPTATITSTAQTRVYLEYHTFTDGQTYVNTSSNGGATFGPPTPVGVGTNTAIPDSNCNTVPSGVSVDQRNGTAYAVWLSGDDVAQNVATGCNITQIGPFNKAWVSKSTNDGLTWMIPSTGPAWTGFYDVTTNTGDNANKLFGSVAVDYAGQVHVLVAARKKDQPLQYVEDCQIGSCVENQADTDLVFVTSPDGGVHWTVPLDINLVHDTDNNPNTNKHTYFYPWIYAGAKGMVDAIYYFSSTTRPNDANNLWFTKFSQITDAVANPPGVGGCPAGNTACYAGAGPQIAAETLLNPQSIHNGSICTFGIFCDVTGGDRSLLDSNNIAIDPAGGANGNWTANANPSNRRVEFACQNSGRSVFDGANAPEPFAGGSAVLNGCYGPTDMSVTKTDSPDPVQPGGTLTYHLTVTNNGMPTMPATTSGVVLTDTLPAGVTFVSATPSSGTCSGTSTVTCALGIFPSGATATVDIVVNAPNASGTLTNTASVAAATSDPNLSNNTATQMTTISSFAPTSVVSRKVHGGAGTFDINLPLTGQRGVECRSPGQTGTVGVDYKVVFAFVNNVTSCGTTPPGGGTVVPGPNANQCTVNLTGTQIPNAQYTTVTLNGVTDVVGNNGSVSAVIGLLIGDVNGDAVNAPGIVDSGDVFLVRQQTGQTTTSANFRKDINASGLIDSGDVFLTRQRTGTQLPSPP